MRFLKIWLLLAVLCLAGLLASSRELRLMTLTEMRALSLAAISGFDIMFAVPGFVERMSPVDGSRDWRLVWGDAELADDPEQAISELRNAIQLNPQSRELRCRLATYLASEVIFEREETLTEWDKRDPFRREQAPPDPQKVEAALKQLEEASRFDPSNGWLDYFSAHVFFAARRDEEGMKAARRAVSKPRWDDYLLGAMRAAAYRANVGGCPRMLAGISGLVVSSAAPRPAQVVLLLTRLAKTFEDRGQHDQAIERYRLAFLLAEEMRLNARTLDDARIAGAWELAAMGRRGVQHVDLPSMQYYAHWPPQSYVETEVARRLRVDRFCAYLSAHGQGDFASHVRAELAAREVIRQQSLSYLAPWASLGGITVKPMWQLIVALVIITAQMLLLGALAAVGFIALFSRLTDLALRAPRFRRLFAALSFLVNAVIRGPRWRLPFALLVLWAIASGIVAAEAWPQAPPYVLPVVGILLFIVTIRTVLIRRRAAGVPGRPSFLLQWLGNVNVASLWLIAIFLTLYLLLFIPVSIYGAHVSAYYQEMFTRGELAALLGW